MKIIHTADLHLDSALKIYEDSDLAKQRNQEILGTFRRLVGYARDNDVQAILICGDMFDSSRIKRSTENIVKSEIIENPDITFFYLEGNHDADSFIAHFQDIPDNLKLFSDEWTCHSLSESVVITGAKLVSGSSSLLQSTILLDNTKINIVMLHGQENEYAMKDKTEMVSLSLLKNKGIDYLALGHVHTYKEAALDGRGVYCYPGCLEGRGFDECGEHGFVLLDINEGTGKIQSSFIPFAYRNIYEIRVDITGLMSTPEIEKAVERAVSEKGHTELSIIKIILEGQTDIETEIDLDIIKDRLKDQFFYVRLKDETSVKIDYDAFELDQSLKGEFVRIVRADGTLSDKEKSEIIKKGIGALRGDKII